MTIKVKLILDDFNKYRDLIQHLALAKCEFSNDFDADVYLIDHNGYHEKVFVCTGKGDGEVIYYRELNYIESDDHYLSFYYGEDKVVTIAGSLKSYEKLFTDDFVRISKSVIVNRTKITNIKLRMSQTFVVSLNKKTDLKVTRSFYHDFKEKIGI